MGLEQHDAKSFSIFCGTIHLPKKLFSFTSHKHTREHIKPPHVINNNLQKVLVSQLYIVII